MPTFEEGRGVREGVGMGDQILHSSTSNLVLQVRKLTVPIVSRQLPYFRVGATCIPGNVIRRYYLCTMSTIVLHVRSSSLYLGIDCTFLKGFIYVESETTLEITILCVMKYPSQIQYGSVHDYTYVNVVMDCEDITTGV